MKSHDAQIAKLVSLKDDNLLGIPEVSQSITKALVQIHENVNKLLKDNNIIPSENEKSKHTIEMIIREVLKL